MRKKNYTGRSCQSLKAHLVLYWTLGNCSQGKRKCFILSLILRSVVLFFLSCCPIYVTECWLCSMTFSPGLNTRSVQKQQDRKASFFSLASIFLPAVSPSSISYTPLFPTVDLRCSFTVISQHVIIYVLLSRFFLGLELYHQSS